MSIVPAPLTRTLSDVTIDIIDAWPAVRWNAPRHHPARLHVARMLAHTSTDLTETFGHDDAPHAGDTVSTFLAESDEWAGLAADRIKAELRGALAHLAVAEHAPVDYDDDTIADLIAAALARAEERRDQYGTGTSHLTDLNHACDDLRDLRDALRRQPAQH